MSDDDWEHREVCPDGGCIGVIGDDGLCKVCGRAAPNWGSERLRGLAPEALDDTDATAGDGADADAGDGDGDGDGDGAEEDRGAAAGEHAGAREGAAAAGDDWDRRELCSNGACLGVIGADGACTVCRARREATA